MSEDFYDRLEKEQELLNLSYQESLRHKNERMAVWDPSEKKTVFSQIKKLIVGLYRGLKGSWYLLYPGILLILVFLLFGLLPGCSWPWQKEKVMVQNPLVIPPFEQNTIACIKLEPECNIDLEN